MLSLDETRDGLLLPIQAQPKARKNAVVGLHAGRLKVAVTQVPEKGKANVAILKVLAEALGLSRSQLSVVSGETASIKKILVTGMNAADLQQRIADCVGGAPD